MPSLSNAPDRPVLPSSLPDKKSPLAEFSSPKSAFHSATMPTRKNWFDTEEDEDDDEDSLRTILTGAQGLSLFGDFAGAAERQDGSPTKKLFEMMLAEERISVLEDNEDKPEGEKGSPTDNK